MTKPAYIDIWLHYHRDGADVYPMFRTEQAPIASQEEVIAAYGVDFEPEEGEELDLAYSAVPIPEACCFSENRRGHCRLCGKPRSDHKEPDAACFVSEETALE